MKGMVEMLTINGIQKVEIEVGKRDLAMALHKVMEEDGYIEKGLDDAGCDWYTYKGCVYISDINWIVSQSPKAVALVDAINILTYGHIMTFYEEDILNAVE